MPEGFGILHVSSIDVGGGAGKVAQDLFQACRARGLHAWLAVGERLGDGRDVMLVPNDDGRPRWARAWMAIGNVLSPLIGRGWGAGWLRSWFRRVGEPGRWLESLRGHEDFAFPGTWRLLDLPPACPDLVHCHNLHGGYFDLRALPWLSQRVPVVLTLHDAWLLTGHCAHSFDCERWKMGCGHCPYLDIYPSIRRDATAYNWKRKQATYAKTKVYVATPSHWLMQKVEQSMLARATLDRRVIPHGIELSIFHPADRDLARSSLDIPQDVRMLLFSGTAVRHNPWKDYGTLREAVGIVAERFGEQRILLIALGEDAPAERVGRAEVRFVPFQRDAWTVGRYYQAADVYVHAARADTFPNAVMEALACGKPVVATAVGGIPEQVKGLKMANGEWRMADSNRHGMDEATGVLVSPKDVEGMAAAIETLLKNAGLRARLGENAARDAARRFDIEREIDEYLAWYADILERNATRVSVATVT